MRRLRGKDVDTEFVYLSVMEKVEVLLLSR